MNEKLQYASMLEIPVSTCSVTKLPTGKKIATKKRKFTEEQVKSMLMEKINNEEEISYRLNQFDDENEQNNSMQENMSSDIFDNENLIDFDKQNNENERDYSLKTNGGKKAKGFSVIGMQLVIIGILLATIFITNVLFIDSGINVFLRGIFEDDAPVVEQVTDQRIYSEFAPVISMGDNSELGLDNGIISFNGEGSIYAPCDGNITNIINNEDGTYSIEISHSDNFMSIINGIEHIYVNVGDAVYKNIPVGYLEADGASICFKNNLGEIIKGYQITDGLVQWAI